MLFEVEQGDDLNDYIAASDIEGPQGEIAREVLAECPLLTPYEQSFYRAFLKLGTMRQMGMGGPGPIPWDKIVEYARYNGFTRTDTDILVRVIMAVDPVWLNANRKIAQQST